MVKREAKDICEKYLSVPATTNFGIMFVPFEGLYAEVVSRPGLIETLGRDYHVNVAGPSTMAAILNSLQMSYQTFKLQKRTDDVLRVLSAVKAELPRYQKALRRASSRSRPRAKRSRASSPRAPTSWSASSRTSTHWKTSTKPMRSWDSRPRTFSQTKKTKANCNKTVGAGANAGAPPLFVSHLSGVCSNVQQWRFALSDAKGSPCLREAPARSTAPPCAARCSGFGVSRARSR